LSVAHDESYRAASANLTKGALSVMMHAKIRTSIFNAGTAAGAIALSLALAAPADAIVPNDNFTPEDVVDNDGGVNGVGMFYRNDGFVCTGTLINPRTVLFAAHCVNDRPESDYDTNGTIQSAFSFAVNALPGFQDWIANSFASNPELFVYNINQILYNPDSLVDPNAFGFLEGDIAVASLDTPAADIPTWALLFSALPVPDSIDPVTGTGYHVNITGYGRSGNGTPGDFQGIDWRRRAAENMIGALTSFDERNLFLFGDPFGDLPQSLYRLDFDDPNGANEFDFNLYRDEPLEREGTTAGGDSGGPLILDAANNTLSSEDLVLGVLSGGSRFFSEQVFSSYGTESFYQPLYLFWDYIAEVNPYRYVSAKNGSGRWENPNHWVSLQDPAYRIIDANGNVVVGTPDAPGGGVDGGTPDFGEVCFDPVGSDPGDGCFDLATGEFTPPSRDIGNDVASGIGTANIAMPEAVTLPGSVANQAGGGSLNPAAAVSAPSVTGPSSGLPTATIENGLPGATGFVPDNIDPDPQTGLRARYFDVTLSAPGQTTLRSTVEIDRLTVAGLARLNIRPGADLTVLTDYTQFGGQTIVNGTLHTGEALIVAGHLTGRGTIDPTYLTVMLGAITPDGNRTGTLTVQGDLILTSAAITAFDLSRDDNDVLAVTGDADNTGIASLGGIAVFSRGPGRTPRHNQSFQIVTAEGGVDGTFDHVLGRVGVLRPELDYGPDDVTVTLRAGRLGGFIRRSSPAAASFADALDTMRLTSYNSLYGLYGAIDVMDPDSLTATLSGLAPTIVNEAMEMGTMQNDMMMGIVTDRLSMLGTSRQRTGMFNVVGSPETLRLAATQASVSDSAASQRSFTGRVVSDGRTLGTLPDNMSGFISGGYENSRTASRFGGRNDAQANWHMAMGMEVEMSDQLTLGGATAFINGRSNLSGSQARVRTNQALAYASYRLGGGAYVAGVGSASVSDIETERYVSGGFESARFDNDTRASNYTLGAEAGMNIGIASDFTLTPRAAMRYTRSEVEGYTEAGSEIALRVEDIREQRIEGRVGIAFEGERAIGRSWTVRPQLSADYVHALGQSDGNMTVRFAEASGVPIVLPGLGYDTSWAEMRGGISLEHGNLSLTTAFETDIARSDRRDDRAVAELSFRF